MLSLGQLLVSPITGKVNFASELSDFAVSQDLANLMPPIRA